MAPHSGGRALCRGGNAWAALGLAFGLVAVVLGISYAGIAGGEEWDVLVFEVAVGVQVPTRLTQPFPGTCHNTTARPSS